MPRTLVFGNGCLFVAHDDRHRIRELTYPYVGLYNHLSGRAARLGVWVDGAFSWCEEDSWEISQRPQAADGSAETSLIHQGQGIQLHLQERIHPRESAFIRTITVKSTRGEGRDVRLLFHQPLQMNESDIAETAVLDPVLGGMVHYKGSTYLAFCASVNGVGPTEVAVGITGFGGQTGTAADAEDGELSNRTIEQGSIDSCMSVRLNQEAGEGQKVAFSVLCADSITGLHELKARLDAEPRTERASSDAGLLTSSRRVIESHLSANGALMAAIDSDIMAENRAHYANFWPRDGALTLGAFDLLGNPEPGRNVLHFCRGLICNRTWPHPCFFQKYRSDGALGPSWHPWVRDGRPELPIQEDESALILHAMGNHIKRFGWHGMTALWEELAAPLAGFLLEYIDPETSLPLPSHDLWEERRGVHAFTVASVVAGLRAAAEMAVSLGDERSSCYRDAAEDIRRACLRRFVHPSEGFVVRNLSQGEGGGWREDLTPDSSMLHVVLLGLLEPDDPLAGALVDRLEAGLWVDGPIGGMARYRDDYYCRVSHGVPGNPWIICTLWLAQALWRLNRTPKDRERALKIFEWAKERQGPTGLFSEQVHPFTGEHLSVSPLVWSHGEFIITAHELGLAP